MTATILPSADDPDATSGAFLNCVISSDRRGISGDIVAPHLGGFGRCLTWS